MYSERRKFQMIDNISIIVGIILIMGVLSMFYGFFKNFSPAIYAGFSITVAGSFYGIFRSIVFRK